MAAGSSFFTEDRIYNWGKNFYAFEKPLLKAASIPVVGALPSAALIIVGLVQAVVGAMIWAICDKQVNECAWLLCKNGLEVFGVSLTFSIVTSIFQAIHLSQRDKEDPFWHWDHR